MGKKRFTLLFPSIHLFYQERDQAKVTMKYSAVPALVYLTFFVSTTSAAVPETRKVEPRAVVSCTANGGAASSCCTGSLTRYGCAHTNTNACSTVGTTPCGSIVQIYCYQFGETVNGNS